MKKSPLLLALTTLAACQSPQDLETMEIQEHQLEQQAVRNEKLQKDIDRAKVQNASLQDQLQYELERTAELQNRVDAQDQELRARDAEVDRMQGELDSYGIVVERRGDFLVLSLPSALTFPSGKADLTKDGQSALKAVADALNEKHSEATFWVEGHTDNVQPKKSGWKSNLELSVARSMSVAEYMQTELGVAGSQLRVSGHGEFAPVEGNDTAEGRSANRRVEILVLDKKN